MRVKGVRIVFFTGRFSTRTNDFIFSRSSQSKARINNFELIFPLSKFFLFFLHFHLIPNTIRQSKDNNVILT
jgi:hypothetical protein